MTYTLSVTQEDIDDGVRDSCGFCPIALSAARVFPDAGSFAVSNIYIEVVDEKFENYKLFYLPLVAVTFIRNFDKFRKVHPITFDISDRG